MNQSFLIFDEIKRIIYSSGDYSVVSEEKNIKHLISHCNTGFALFLALLIPLYACKRITPTIPPSPNVTSIVIPSATLSESTNEPEHTDKVTPLPAEATIDQTNISLAERGNVMLNVVRENSTFYQDLVGFCTKDFIAGRTYYNSSYGYILTVYNQEQLCSIASFTLQNNTWKINWIQEAGYKGELQLDEVTKAVFNDPSTFLDLIALCSPDFRNGSPLYIKVLDSPTGYYIVPFFNDKGLCFTASYYFQNGKWNWTGSTEYNAGIDGDTYPQVNGDTVKEYIEKMTCQKIIGIPQYIDPGSSYYPPGPYWEVTTEDGQTYFVLGNHAWNAKDDFRIWLEPKNCLIH
jgi:hypothetical protein